LKAKDRSKNPAYRLIRQILNVFDGFLKAASNSNRGIRTSSDHNPNVASRLQIKSGAFGDMSGTNCDQPMSKFDNAPKAPNGGTALVDVFYELSVWRAAR
jgi:hypothetical protein